ncbi:MAG: hypothetical protein WAV95_04530 [Azonexus sp.]
MKKWLFAALLHAAFGTAPALAAPAHSAFAAFWSDFQAAIAQSDKPALIPLIKLPPTAEIRPLTPDAYVKEQVKTLLKLRRCLAKTRPVKDGSSYSAFCGEQGMSFDRVDGEYKFIEFFAND